MATHSNTICENGVNARLEGRPSMLNKKSKCHRSHDDIIDAKKHGDFHGFNIREVSSYSHPNQ